jgi:hypothetical protein
VTPTRAGRLYAAAALLVVALGLGWGGTVEGGYVAPGLLLPTTYVSPISGDVSVGSQYFAGYYVPGFQDGIAGYESDVRIVLLPAAAVLWFAARRRTPVTRRLARIATGAIGVLLVLALSRGMAASALVMIGALALVLPVTAPDVLARLRRRSARAG